MLSPDPFADCQDHDDSFENFLPTPSTSRRRSEAIVLSEEDSLDGLIGSEQVTVIENVPNDTILKEQEDDDSGDEQVNLDDTITRMLESSDEEEADIEVEPQNDALANLLRSFTEGTTKRGHAEQEEEREDDPNMSIDVFGDLMQNKPEEEKEEEEETQVLPNSRMIPVHLPNQKEAITRKRRCEPSEPSTSTAPLGTDGPVGVVSSDTGEYWNQPKTITVHGQNFEINSFNDYMRMKITKLNHQVNSEKSKPYEKVSETLKGYSVFVNGYTEPPALVIRDLMMAHGGEYHCYYQHGITTYTIASSIATAKVNRIREKEIFIRADWITESIAAGKPLDYRDFLIYEKGAQEKGQMQQFLRSSNDKPIETSSTSSSSGFLDARNPNFIRDYYARSRLHLISTLAQDMKDFVANLKLEGKLTAKCFLENELAEMGRKLGTGTGIQTNTVFHVDLDCFFVSVAVRDRVDLRDKEVAITHSKGTISNSMSEVASCSYAARSCGVKNGMLVRDALQKCPQLVLLPYQFDDYIQVSRQIYEILASYTLDLRAVSCDEMYINMSSLCEKYGISDPTAFADHIRKVIREKTRCPASVGIGSTSLLARLATRHAKPDGVFWVTEEKKTEFMLEEKVRDLPGLGYEMMNRLTSFFGEITTCSQLQQRTERELIPVFGPKLATKVFNQCRGTEEDPENFWKTHVRKSVSCDINYGIRFKKKEEVLQLMTAIGAELERKLLDCKMSAGSITLKLMVRSADAPVQTSKFMGHGRCDTFTKTCNISVSTTKGKILTSECMRLYAKVSPNTEDLRGVGVTCGKLKSKFRKDAASVVQEMFGKGKRDPNADDPIQKKAVQEEPIELEEDDDRHMRNKVVNIPSTSNQNQKTRNIAHPTDVRIANEITLPGLIKLSKCYIKKSVKTYEDVEDEELEEKCLAELGTFLQDAPAKHSVLGVLEILEELLNAGKLSTFQSVFRKFEEMSMNSTTYHVDWFAAFHSLVPHIKETSERLLEFPVDVLQNVIGKLGTTATGTAESHLKPTAPQEIFVPETTSHTYNQICE
ncbi:hypothetical protein L5515_013996 [Caenorhabditis briggsae]|uniref:DNA repair protein REV1 n=1 Tax=Caenorhabditis briggsae TaxID=6238 RepID=A0AAE9EBY8_CAEBR|nr:hypothetical protein L5515_013996 [Caenorhabditis briggsae]